MRSLDNLLIIGIRDNPEIEFDETEAGMPHYYLNLWKSDRPSEPLISPVPYRGGYIGGFNDVTAIDQYLLVADGEGILAYDLANPFKGYTEFTGVGEVSEMMCRTSNYLVSCLDNLIQILSLNDIVKALQKSCFSDQPIDIPFKEIHHSGEGDTALSMVSVENNSNEIVLLNNANDETHLIDPVKGQTHRVRFLTEQQFPYTFQRQDQYHPIKVGDKEYTIFTESTSNDMHPNRIYSLDIRGPPTIKELEPLELENRQILSMVPTLYNQLTLLTDHNGRNYIESFEPNRRKILNSRPLNRRYELGDRLQQVDNDLLIVDHLKNEIVDVATEDSIHLTGAENDVPIPEISSTWEVPQYLYVTKLTPETRR